MLVEDRLAHACPFGDVIHGGRVIALRHEDLPGGPQDLGPALFAGEPGHPAGARVLGLGHAHMLVVERAAPRLAWSDGRVVP